MPNYPARVGGAPGMRDAEREKELKESTTHAVLVSLLTTIARQAQPWPAGVRREGFDERDMQLWSKLVRELVEVLGKSYPRAYQEAIAQLPEKVRNV